MRLGDVTPAQNDYSSGLQRKLDMATVQGVISKRLQLRIREIVVHYARLAGQGIQPADVVKTEHAVLIQTLGILIDAGLESSIGSVERVLASQS